MLQKSPDPLRGNEFVVPFGSAWSGSFGQPMFGSVISGAFNVGSAFAAVNVEWLNFVSRRLKEDFAFAQRLGVCTGPDEAWRAYSLFLFKAANDYQKEFAEMARLRSRVAVEGAAVMQTATKATNPDKDDISQAA